MSDYCCSICGSGCDRNPYDLATLWWYLYPDDGDYSKYAYTCPKCMKYLHIWASNGMGDYLFAGLSPESRIPSGLPAHISVAASPWLCGTVFSKEHNQPQWGQA